MAELNLAGISVYIEQDVHKIYEDLVSRSSKKAEDCPFATMKDVFMLAACLGAQQNRHKKLEASRDIFSGETFDKQTDIPILAALAFRRDQNLEDVTNPKRIVEIAQEWANVGIHTIQDELLLRPGRPLYNLVEMLLPETPLKST